MRGSFLQVSTDHRGLVFDPRTKLLLLITMSTFVLGGIAGEKLSFLLPCFCVLPFVLLLTARKYKTAALYFILYTGSYLLNLLATPHLTGFPAFLVLGCAGILTRFMPSMMLAVYVVSSMTVSEFTAAMQRLHLSEKIIIPMSVMFRFFPTVADEFSSINAAMKMRGIAFGGKNAGKMLEYRLIPLMTCTVKIGDELSAAALTRGLGGTVKRTNVCKIGFHAQDVIAILFCAGCFGFLILDVAGVL